MLKRVRKFDFWMGWLLLVVGLPCLVWGNWPLSRVVVVDLALAPGEMALPGGEDPASQPAPQEGRRLVVTAPAFARLGDDEVIEARLEDLPQKAEGQVPDLDLTHNLVAETRLETSGLLIAPGAGIYSSLRQGYPAVFTWDLRPLSSGVKDFTLWLHLQYVPHPDPLEKVFPERKLLAAPQFQVRVASFLGLAGTPVRVIGGVCTVLGSLLLLAPFLLRLIGRPSGQPERLNQTAPDPPGPGEEPHA